MAETTEVTIGGLKIELRIDDDTIKNSQDKVERDLDATAGRIEKRFAKIGAAVGVAIAAAATAVTAAVAMAINHADNLGKAAQKIGIATEELSRLEYAGKLADVSLETLTASVGKLNRSIAEAAQNPKSSIAGVFEGLQVAIQNADGSLRSSDEVLKDLADRFAAMPDGVQKTAVAMEVFGRSGAQLIPLLNEGKKGLAAMADEADRLGITIDSATAATAERFNDSLTTVQAALGGVANKIMVEVLPYLDQFADAVADPAFAEGAAWLAKTIIGAINQIIAAIGTAINWMRQFRDFFSDTAKKSTDGLKERLTWLGDRPAQIEKSITDVNKRLATGGFDTMWGINDSNLKSQLETYKKELLTIQDEKIEIFKEIDRRQLELTKGLTNMPSSTVVSEDAPPGFEYTPPPSGGGTSGSGGKNTQEERLKKLQADLQTERETQLAHFEEQKTQLQEFLDAEVITKAEYDELMQRAEQEHWEKMKGIRAGALTDMQKFTEMSFKDQAKTIFGELEKITAGVAQENDALFMINKAAAVANAIINTYEGVSKSLATYPMPFAAIMAGVHAAAGFAQVSAILATNRNSKSAAPVGISGGGSTAAQAASAQGEAGNSTMTVMGLSRDQLFNGEGVRDIAQRLLDYQKDGGQVIFLGDE